MAYGDQPRPRSVEIGASLLATVGVCIVGRVAYGVAVNLSQDQWSAGARGVFLVLNSFVLLFGLFVLLLGDQVRRGRTWAWITGLVILPFTILFGALLLLITALSGAIPWAGAGVVLVATAALITLTAPRATRAYFARTPAHPAPVQAWSGGRS
ncbi:hypothetical protein BJ973_005024 [Actinoplanes tereljensis]|uniref:Uncharacterized protein n=1 Tax=Paractinoplanes tereljensis TaxID=571912 RepID=A0A919TTC4_9ACTN|nr:hypothetical protein [Actinoplanes tereljensis]GIF21531.1 hypothetical protein Ate02nite_42610 [Actinoplanes tereljensis]